MLLANTTSNLIILVNLTMVLWVCYNLMVKILKCRYCGKTAGHDPHCPFKDTPYSKQGN